MRHFQQDVYLLLMTLQSACFPMLFHVQDGTEKQDNITQCTWF